MKNFVILTMLFLFLMYWGVTIFFMFPDNPANIKSLKYRKHFEIHLSQKWDFFAPPPTSNDRLYFTFYYTEPGNIKEKIKSFEVLVPITSEKRKKAPFNKKQEVLDYVISGSVHELQNSIGRAKDLVELQYTEDKSVLAQSEKDEKVIKILESTQSFQNLSNYARIVAKENGIPVSHAKFKMTFTEINIPKYVDKRSKKKKIENIILSTNIHPLKIRK